MEFPKPTKCRMCGKALTKTENVWCHGCKFTLKHSVRDALSNIEGMPNNEVTRDIVKNKVAGVLVQFPGKE